MVVFMSSILFSILITIVIIFQAALALGVPWGEYAMGGKFPGKFPPSMRIASLIQIVILIFLALIVLSKSGLLLPGWSIFAHLAIWIVVAFSAIAVFLNIITRSVRERKIWAPVSLLMLITSLTIAFT